jgi:ssDNA-binding Zn-finger/Zn-ribbon topoisomerase 1
MVDIVKKAGSALGQEELPEQEYDCPKHGKYRGIAIKFEFLDKVIAPSCPKCFEESKAEREKSERKRREEEKKAEEERSRQRLIALNIGERNWGVYL